MDKNKIILGSGDLYCVAYSESTGIPTDAVIETEGNSLGRISGGATLEYKPTTYEVKDDTQYVVKRFIQSESVTFKSGVLTWDVENMKKLAGTGDYDSTKGELKIGGRGKNGLTPYIVRFVHKEEDFTVRITLVGTSDAGLSLAFDPEKETIVDAEFAAVTQDNDGTLVIITETAN